jgi:predicted polyphosphate/ATP-dependent NAD kinase
MLYGHCDIDVGAAAGSLEASQPGRNASCHIIDQRWDQAGDFEGAVRGIPTGAERIRSLPSGRMLGRWKHMRKLGVIVNPIAGMGGRVGLKGSDGPYILRKARKLGAKPESPGRAVEALHAIAGSVPELQVTTYPGEMGEVECQQAGLAATVIGEIKEGQTSAQDTRRAARQMQQLDVDLLLFVGGDGTARDIYDAVGDELASLGVPAGVKIHSAVFAVTPHGAGQAAARFLRGSLDETRLTEVMDIDEQAFRRGEVCARLYGYLRIPEAGDLIQASKVGELPSERQQQLAIGEQVAEYMEHSDAIFIVGPGTTTAAIMEVLGLKDTLLGVDLVSRGQVMANDVGEAQILQAIEGRAAKIVVTVIGGQGSLFGRGNQQISPAVIRKVGKENIIVAATKSKLRALRGMPLLVDTGDAELDQALGGYVQVVTGYKEFAMRRIGCQKG